MRSHSRFHWLGALLVPALAGLLAACPAAPPPPAPPAPVAIPQYTIEQFMGNVSLNSLSFSPDGSRVLASNDSSGVFNVYAYPLTGGPPEALTQSTTSPIGAIGYFPDGQRVLVSSDQGGNEISHLYVRKPDGTLQDLTPGEKNVVGFIEWAPDDKGFFYQSNGRDNRFFDVFEMSTADYKVTPLFRNDDGYDVAAVSPDRRYLALGKSTSTSDSDVYLHDRTSGKTEKLTPHEGNAANQAMTFSPDGKYLLYTTDIGHEFSYLVRHELATGKREELMRLPWDVGFAAYSKTGKYLAVFVNADARTEIKLFDAATMTGVPLPSLPSAELTNLGISPDETRIAFIATTARSPGNLYTALIRDTTPPVQLTHTLNPAIQEEHLVDAEVVRFPSYDGVEIPGILYKPKTASKEAKVPALIWIHGGPGGQSRVGYSEGIQYLANHGYAVYAINNRGSSGYGKTFFRMDDQKHGEADLDDVVAAKKMLIGTGWVNPDKIGVLGGSYGGYLTLAALTFRPEEFAVGVNLYGVANWPRTLESIPAWWEAQRKALYEEMGDPAKDGDRLRRISPLFHADKIRRPLMVLQGANDPRVLQIESDEIVAAVKKNNVPVEYVIFPDEGHGFRKKENRAKAWSEVLKFLEAHLKGGA